MTAEFRTAASEFPNDNPELHDGTVFVCLRPCAAPRALGRPPRRVEPAPKPAAPAPGPMPSAPEPSISRDPFAELGAVLARVALELGATRAAAVVGALIAGDRVDHAQMPPPGLSLLVERGMVQSAGSAVVLSGVAGQTAATWKRVLRGESVDCSGCESTLDSFCAALLAALLGAPARQESLRRELRAKGVVAFGFLAAAA
jgi:hypothetical protein